jgi:hypothetical protein
MKIKLVPAAVLASLLPLHLAPGFGQGTAFTYQGQLTQDGSPPNGIYDLRFTLHDALSGGGPQGGAYTNLATAVSNGLFTVTVDFGNQFPGADRWLELGVRTNGGGGFTTLSPRQQVTATPYAIQSANAAVAANAITATTATNFSGSLSGNVTGPQAATVVNTVGGVTAANVAAGANAANAATSANTVNAIVRRDAGGNFSAGSLTLAGNLSLPVTTASAGILKLGGVNLLHAFGSQNVFLGAGAGNQSLTGTANTGTGFEALLANTTGSDNAAHGANTLRSNTSGGANTAVGSSALSANLTGNNNTAVGAYTLGSNTNGIQNTASGAEALYANTSGSGNTAIGMLSLRFNLTGNDNTAVGREALLNNTTGFDNTAIGVDALHNNLSGTVNTAVGRRALYSNTNGGNNTASGWGALQNNTSGSQNTANGVNALGGNTTGTKNSAIGFSALAGNTTGDGNTASGFQALFANGSGTENTAAGAFALMNSAGGSKNTAVGFVSLQNNTAGSNNIALGYQAGFSVTDGSFNILIGSSGTVSDNKVIRIGGAQTNTFIAGISGTGLPEGEPVVVNSAGQLGTSAAVGVWGSSAGNVYRTNGNVGIGTAAPARPLHIATSDPVINLQDTGHSSIGQIGYISYRNDVNAETAWVGYGTVADPDFSIVTARFNGNIILNPMGANGNVGIARKPTANKLEVEGSASKTASGSWLANSDARIKTAVRTVTGALDKLAQVRLVEFHYTDAYRAQHPSLKDRSYLNVIAQEFQKVFPDDVQSSGETLPNGEAILQVDTYPLTIYSAAAIQELNERSKLKETEITELKARLERLERFFNEQNGGAK